MDCTQSLFFIFDVYVAFGGVADIFLKSDGYNVMSSSMAQVV